mmetsp:Transcript_15201/g.49504  ORF Transcript_15201/g.49504 Transcript_15201/m.49504 type:complete len:222 (-) Transcript_15201:435-1100(-)
MSSSAAAALVQKLRLPMVGSPLFLVSTPKLVVAQCRAGILGSFPALNARGPNRENVLDEWLTTIKAELPPGTPFAVNQIVHKSNARLERDMEVIAEHKVPVVITSLGARREINDAVRAYGGMVFHDVTTQTHARKAVDKGADGLILVAAGAGGHAGKVSPFALVAETRSWFDGPLCLAGGVGTGAGVAAAVSLALQVDTHDLANLVPAAQAELKRQHARID